MLKTQCREPEDARTMSMVLVPYSVEQDETGAWCARADLGQFGVAYGEGDTPQRAFNDLENGVALVFEDEGLEFRKLL